MNESNSFIGDGFKECNGIFVCKDTGHSLKFDFNDQAPISLNITNDDKGLPPMQHITFSFDGKEILKLDGNGDIYVKGNLTVNDIDVVEGLRHFLRCNKYAI